MSIDLYWDNDDQTVMLAEFGQQWTWDELYAVLKTIKRLSDERNQVFGAMVDVRNGFNIPGNLLSRESLNQFKRISELGSGGKGPVVIVGVSPMIRRVFDAINMVDRNFSNDVHFAPDMNQAREMIYRRVSELNAAVTA